MSASTFPSLEDLISADPTPDPVFAKNDADSKDAYFISRRNPERLGNAQPIAFGGCVISVAVNAAFQTVPQSRSFHLYSVLGSFHSPSKVDRKLNCTVTSTRNTKTFATRRVVVSQSQDDSSQRTCADFFIDFQAEEPAALLAYDPTPSNTDWLKNGPTHPTRTTSQEDNITRLIDNEHITTRQAMAFKRMFALSETYLELRHCSDSVSGINLMGLASRLPTPQDHLPTPAKATAEWIRVRPDYALPSEPLNIAALSFFMDQALSFLPLNHTHRGFEDAGACSTLEFALRIFRHDVRMDQWHFRERKCVQAGAGRTYNEGRLWTEQGGLVASMSQVCILRPPPEGKVSKDKSGGKGAVENGIGSGDFKAKM